jgi:hypothetical protein
VGLGHAGCARRDRAGDHRFQPMVRSGVWHCHWTCTGDNASCAHSGVGPRRRAAAARPCAGASTRPACTELSGCNPGATQAAAAAAAETNGGAASAAVAAVGHSCTTASTRVAPGARSGDGASATAGSVVAGGATTRTNGAGRDTSTDCRAAPAAADTGRRAAAASPAAAAAYGLGASAFDANDLTNVAG